MEKSAATQRLAKRIAAAGICSRREAERRIEAGEVEVNGEVITSPATNVSDEDKVSVGGELIAGQAKTRLWLYHKPAGLLTTHKDPQGRPTVFDHLPPGLPRVISVGRLDMNSEGLLLLTNSGGLARTLELPKTGLARTYKIRVFGKVTPNDIRKLKRGVSVGGIQYGSIAVKIVQETQSNSWLEVTLHEGKNREIRKVFEHLGHQVSRLIRISYGPFELGALGKGQAKEVPHTVLKKRLSAEKISV